MANTVAWGFAQLEDIFDNRVADVEPERLNTAVIESAEAHTRDVEAVLDELTTPTTQRDGAFALPTGGELQPVSENGTPLPTKGGADIQQGYPLMRGADSFGSNREAYAKMTVGEMNEKMLAVQSKDARWMIRRAFAALFTNASWTYKEPGRTDLTVRGLAVTGDGSIFLDDNGNLTTANHYTFQAGAIDNSNDPFEENETILRAHPANVGQIVAYIPSGLLATTRALADFDPWDDSGLIEVGDDTDVVSDSVADFLGFGNKVIGVVGETIVVLSRRLPANYVVSIVQGVEKPLVMRQEPEASLQGLQMIYHQVDSNFRKWDFYRKAGFAVRNPIAVAIRQISAGAYAIPTDYNAASLPG